MSDIAAQVCLGRLRAALVDILTGQMLLEEIRCLCYPVCIGARWPFRLCEIVDTIHGRACTTMASSCDKVVVVSASGVRGVPLELQFELEVDVELDELEHLPCEGSNVSLVSIFARSILATCAESFARQALPIGVTACA